MKVESVGLTGGPQVALPNAADKVADLRKKKEEVEKEPQAEEKNQQNQVPPEELLKKIKGLTEDGAYSVRFEKDEAAEELVVKIVDRETDEVVRQVPAEELLELRAALEDLRGNLVDMQS